MEKTIILVDDVPSELLDSIKAPIERQRFLYYTDKLEKKNYDSANYRETDDGLYYSESSVALHMGSKLYLKRKNKKGFTFDKQTKKLSMWFGSSVNQLSDIETLLKALKLEWVVQEKIVGWLTKTLLERILAGAITNPKDACKFIVAQSRIKMAPEQLRKFIKGNGQKSHLLNVKDVFTTLDKGISFRELENGGILADVVQQAKALGRKIDPTWSTKRLAEVHDEWTNELMSMEMDGMKDERVTWKNIKLPDEFELIASKKRLFAEGNLMHHCIYTNYWGVVKRKQYMVLHAKDEDGNEATVGLHVNGQVKFDAAYAKYNKSASSKIRMNVLNLLRNKEFLTSVKDGKKTKQLK